MSSSFGLETQWW